MKNDGYKFLETNLFISYRDKVSAARNVKWKLDTLMRYACQVEKEIENQIDHKFYEEIDRVVYNLEYL